MIERPNRLSYSSLNSYMECGQRWLLERGYKLNEGTWFATVSGSAVHNITEMIDLKEIGLFDGEIPTFKEEFDRLLDLEAEKGITVKPSGRVTKVMGKTGGPNKKDYHWYLLNGPIHVQNWIDWKKDCGLVLATLPNGKPAIEVPLPQDLGGEKNLGFIDRIYIRMTDHAIIVVDIKTGKVPASKLQLASYRAGLKKEHGLDAILGSYWMASDGELTPLADLTVYSTTYVDSLYEQAWRGIDAGVFLPNVTGMCAGCSVKRYCRAVGGDMAITIPMRETVVVKPRVDKAA